MQRELRAVITGGGSGLGRALALDIAGRGGQVVVADIDEVGATETAHQVERAGGEAHVVRCDVGDPADVDRLAEKARSLLGEVDFLANNAGVSVSGPFEQITSEDWEWIVNINLWGVVNGCRSFLPAMRARGRGLVLNVASLAGLVSTPKMAPYNLTKASVVALSETLYGEYRAHGVHVGVLCPAFFATRILESGRGMVHPQVRERVEEMMRRSRLQAPDVARIAVDGMLRGQLYIVPMRQGRVLWRLQRLWPQGFYRWVLGARRPPLRDLRRVRDLA
jgi:NAD(P)-dependent dehydrogenase (short-subunit alcohol dehydrogenase family)